MIKNRHLPNGLRDFNTQFSQLTRKYEASQVFDDFLSVVICCMARQTQEGWYFETIKRYTRDEIDVFVKMFAHLQIIYSNAFLMGEWADPLGDFYEELASNSKKSGLGQFFTPAAICDLMAMITIPEGEWGKKILEPCAGSGRNILAINKQAPGNYYVAQDIDAICCKMTAINLCFHKVRAEVHCMDALAMNTPKFTLHVNYNWHKHKTLVILKQ